MTSTFAALGVPSDVTGVLRDAGIEQPFPIQQATVPAALAGRDLCGRAPTGSGKTLAFALPLAIRSNAARPKRPAALVLTPTRELAAQVRATLLPLAEVRGRRVATVYGGTDIRRDVKRLRAGVDILVATPGRLADLVRRGDVSLEAVELVVLDEADRMADMGFLPQVTALLDTTSPTRQTLLFSATLDGDVDVLVRRYQNDPLRAEVDEPAEQAGDVRHLFWHTDRSERRAVTARVVKGTAPAIVFTRTKRGADRLTKQLNTDGIRAAAIHGDRTQRQRDRALGDFHSGRCTTLVATDVAARGIHVDDVAVVVHYDLPATDKDYVHRSGRTGRAGATGVVVSLVTSDDRTAADGIQRALGLPRGLHTLDLAHLTSAEVPEPVPPRAAHREGPTNAGRGKGQGKGHGKGKGRRPRAHHGGSGAGASSTTRRSAR